MAVRDHVELIREGEFLAEVHVSLEDGPGDWAPYLSPDDARRLDDIRAALKAHDLQRARQMARIYQLTPLTTS